MRVLRASGAVALLLLPIDLPERMAQAFAPSPSSNRTLHGHVSKNATLASILDNVIGRPRVHDLVETARPLHDLKRLAAGHPYGVSIRPDGQLDGFSYGIDDLKTLRVLRKDGQLRAEIVERHYEVKIEKASGTVRSSLFGAIEDAGEEDQLALDLSEIFAWDVDFNTEVQKGDSFKVSVEKLTLDGRFVRYGRILAAEFQNGPRRLQALRYEAERGPGYYAPSGAPLRKAFLRSPLRFTRISSGYSSSRFHPILGRHTAHYGIDYAAPTGTTVNASADGVVTLAGFTQGLGNTVKLRHANGFETQYGHLSKILARPGERVIQGTAIGLVGSTGLSTGPHLHYIMFRNGGYTNPMKVQLPPAEPIPEQEREDFERVRNVAMRLLDSGSNATATAAALAQLGPPRTTVLRR